MSEYAFYSFMNEHATLEDIEKCDNDRHWPQTFEEFMDWAGTSIQSHNPEYTDDMMKDMWKIGI